jgi:hypothetical protein
MLPQAFTQFYKDTYRGCLIVEESEGVLKHLTHLEELILTRKEEGLKIALHIIEQLYKVFVGHNDAKILVTTKYDGCIHPESKLITDRGHIEIEKIINSKENIKVLSHNFSTGLDEWNVAEFPRINNNEKKWVEITLEDDSTFKCTADHRVYTENRGWVEAQFLTSIDILKEIHP